MSYSASTGKSISANTGGVIEVTGVSGNASVALQAGSFQVNGNPYSGNVIVQAAYLDPAADDFASYFAGDESALRTDATETSLLSYGVLRVVLRGVSGETVQLDPTKPATLTFPTPKRTPLETPDHIPLWFFDQQTGKWVEDGIANRNGTQYVGVVGHFTDWNLDIPTSRALLRGVVRCEGRPLTGVLITVGQTETKSGPDGRFECRVPTGADLELHVNPDRNNELFYSDQITIPRLTAGESREIQIALTSDCPATVVGTITNAEGTSISGSALWTLRNGHYLISSTNNGEFQIQIPSESAGALQLSSWKCTDLENVVLEKSSAGSLNNVGKVAVCEAGETYKSEFPVNNLAHPVASLFPNGETIVVGGKSKEVRFFSVISGEQIGAFTLPSIPGFQKVTDLWVSPKGDQIVVTSDDEWQSIFSYPNCDLIANSNHKWPRILTYLEPVVGSKILRERNFVDDAIVREYSFEAFSTSATFDIIRITGDRNHAVLQSSDDSIVILDLSEGEISERFFRLWPHGLIGFSADRTVAAVRRGSNLGYEFVDFYDLRSNQLMSSVYCSALAAALHPSGKWYIESQQYRANPVELIDTRSGKVFHALPTSSKETHAGYSFDQEGKTVSAFISSMQPNEVNHVIVIWKL
jgi:hypothetical protein